MAAEQTPKYCFDSWIQAGIQDQPVDRQLAMAILNDPSLDLMDLLHAAWHVRRHYFGNTVAVQVLDNVQNGACSEDCHYCGQSRSSNAPIQPYRMKTMEQVLETARKAKAMGAWRLCMALSGRGPNDMHIDQMVETVKQVKAMGLKTCLSAGFMDDAKMQRLKDAGLDRINHNLNTSEQHYEKICTTHSWQQRLATLRQAKRLGLSICSGLIVGLGESHEDLVDLAYILRDVRADSIPCNFLLPICGNKIDKPICNGKPITPRFVLRVLCMFRMVNPSAEIRIAAGRELHLRSLQPLALYPASSLFADGYLLTKGSDAEQTLRMIIEAGFVPRLAEGDWPEQLQALARDSDETLVRQSLGLDDALGLKSEVQRR